MAEARAYLPTACDQQHPLTTRNLRRSLRAMTQRLPALQFGHPSLLLPVHLPIGWEAGIAENRFCPSCLEAISHVRINLIASHPQVYARHFSRTLCQANSWHKNHAHAQNQAARIPHPHLLTPQNRKTFYADLPVGHIYLTRRTISCWSPRTKAITKAPPSSVSRNFASPVLLHSFEKSIDWALRLSSEIAK